MPTLDPAELAVWRYGVISALLHRNEADGTLEDALILLASRQYRKLDGKVVSCSPETLRACLIIDESAAIP